MATAKVKLVQQRQNPLRERYRRVPTEAWIRDGAQTINAAARIRFTVRSFPPITQERRFVSASTAPSAVTTITPIRAICCPPHLRPASTRPCECSPIIWAFRLQSLEVKVEAECDVRGCLLVERSVPVGFQKMRCSVRLQPEGQVEAERLQMLLGAAEGSCVVLQTLRNGVTVTAQIDNAEAEAVKPALTATSD